MDLVTTLKCVKFLWIYFGLGWTFPFWRLNKLTVPFPYRILIWIKDKKVLPLRISPSQLEPWGFDISSFLHGEFQPCVKQRMMSFCSVQNSHWNTVHILFSLLRCLLCKLCKIFLQKCCLFWAFQQTVGYFWKTLRNSTGNIRWSGWLCFLQMGWTSLYPPSLLRGSL